MSSLKDQRFLFRYDENQTLAGCGKMTVYEYFISESLSQFQIRFQISIFLFHCNAFVINSHYQCFLQFNLYNMHFEELLLFYQMLILKQKRKTFKKLGNHYWPNAVDICMQLRSLLCSSRCLHHFRNDQTISKKGKNVFPLHFSTCTS